MRMWMVDPEIMCRKHLLGEHVELHMFVGAIKAHKSLDGYIKNNLVRPLIIDTRHDSLVHEMEKRGYKHRTPLVWDDYMCDLYQSPYTSIWGASIDTEESLKELIERCSECKSRFIAKCLSGTIS